MGEIIASLDGYFCSPEHNFNWKTRRSFSSNSAAREILGQWRRRSSAGISYAGNDRRPTGFAAQTLATAVKRFGAVSSVVSVSFTPMAE